MTPQQRSFGHEPRQDARRPRADGCHGADLADALVHGHDHHVHHAGQHDGHQNDLDEHRHQVDHPRQAGEGRQIGPGVDVQLRPAASCPGATTADACAGRARGRLGRLAGDAAQGTLQSGRRAIERGRGLQAVRDLTDLGLLQAQQLACVVDWDVAVATSRTPDPLGDAADDEGPAVDRAVAVGRLGRLDRHAAAEPQPSGRGWRRRRSCRTRRASASSAR